MSSLGEAVVDLAAVAANVRTVAAVARTDLMAVVKADGFGHGAVAVARAAIAAGAGWLGLTSSAEALSLRVDFFLPAGESGEPALNEVNTFPGMTAESQFPQIWHRAGIPFAALLDLLVAGVTRPRATGARG
jgi:hypothetical protein